MNPTLSRNRIDHYNRPSDYLPLDEFGRLIWKNLFFNIKNANNYINH